MPAPEPKVRAAERFRKQLEAEGARVERVEDRPEPEQRRAKNLAAVRRASGAALVRGAAGVGRAMRAPFRWIDRARTRMPDKKFADSDSPFLIIGHRGAPKRIVENTLPSCQFAIDNGANAIEIDLSMTKDGHVVLWHDWNPNDTVALARQLGLEPNVKYLPRTPRVWDSMRRMVHELTLDELREHHGYQRSVLFFFRKRVEAHIPTLREFFDWAKSESRLRAVFLDVKIPGALDEHAAPFAQNVRALIDEFEPSFECVFMTPHKNILRAMKPHAGDAPFSWDIEVAPGVVLDEDKYSGVRSALEEKNGVASIGRPALTWGAWKLYQEIIESDVKRLRDHHRDAEAAGEAPHVDRLISWTINARGEHRRLIRLGVQGILTDDPRRLERLALREGRRLA